MAKFAAVQTSAYADSNQDALKNFTCSDLKKKFKCKKVLEVKDYKFKNTKAAEFAQIAEYEINTMHKKLTSIDLRNYSDIKYRKQKFTKIFIFSEEAASTAFAFDILKDDYVIKLFELNDENVDDFIQSIERLISSDDDISSLNEAKNICERLSDIENELGINVIQFNAVEDIDEKISDIEDEVEASKESLEEIFETQWN
jgi:hypothetical protein